MILGIVGLLMIVISIIIFLTFPQKAVDPGPAIVMMLIGVGLSMADPIILAPLGKALVNLPWVGGA